LAWLGVWSMDTFPEFGALVGGPVIPCSDMHQSFTDAIVGIIVLGMRIEFSQQILLSLLSH